MLPQTEEEQQEYFTLGVFETLSFKYNPDPAAIKTLLQKGRFAEKFDDLFGRVWFLNRDLSFEDFCAKCDGEFYGYDFSENEYTASPFLFTETIKQIQSAQSGKIFGEIFWRDGRMVIAAVLKTATVTRVSVRVRLSPPKTRNCKVILVTLLT